MTIVSHVRSFLIGLASIFIGGVGFFISAIAALILTVIPSSSSLKVDTSLPNDGTIEERVHRAHNRRSGASHCMSTLSDDSRTTSTSSSSSSLDLKTPPITSTTFQQPIYISSTSIGTLRDHLHIPHSPSPSNPHASSHPYSEEMILPRPGTSEDHLKPQSDSQSSPSPNPIPSTVSPVSVNDRRRNTTEELRPHHRPLGCFKRSLSEKMARRASNSHQFDVQQTSPPPVPDLPSHYVKSNKRPHTAATNSDRLTTLHKATSTSRITTKCYSHSTPLPKRRSQPLRTQPYEAPYFFPQPGTAAAAEYVPDRAKPTRSQTLLPKT